MLASKVNSQNPTKQPSDFEREEFEKLMTTLGLLDENQDNCRDADDNQNHFNAWEFCRGKGDYEITLSSNS